MKTTRKILSILLVLLMCITAVPLSGYDLGTVASAADTVNCISKANLESGNIYFGSYPQSKVTDSTITAELEKLAPEWDNWTSYGYYSGTGSTGSMKQGDWMRYTDVTYNGVKYRGVKFTEYRPYNTNYEHSDTMQSINGYSTNTVYWFKFESLKWRVLDAEAGLIMCTTVIDSQPYNNTINSNDYETSSIKEWLNRDFYNTAFTSADQSTIATSTPGKIFLLSNDEVLNANYGFNSNSGAWDSARKAQGSDYAKCQGLSSSEWILRSPGSDSNRCYVVLSNGTLSNEYGVDNSFSGVRPALKLNPDSLHTWTHTDAKDATCTDDGNVEYWYCETCKTYIVKNEKGEYVKTTKAALYNEIASVVKDGNYIYFGSYPQSKVTDSTITAELEKLAPEWDNWTSYGYYTGTGSDGTMVQGDWMRYTDVTYGGEKYRGVKFTEYRQSLTYYSAGTFTWQNDNGYNTNTVYWFKFESLKWRVLDQSTGFVMCENVIDSQPYSSTIYSKGEGDYAHYNDASYTHHASDYETSSIRAWLNDDFYNTAFTSADQSAIATTTLNNDGYYTLIGTTGHEKLDSNDTKDKVFLMSYDEMLNTDYGFNSSDSKDKKRIVSDSDYAECQGLKVVSGSTKIAYWSLRSPGKKSHQNCGVDYTGKVVSNHGVSSSYYGIRPALKLNLDSVHTWTHTNAKAATSCTNDGNVEYWYCGDCDVYITKDSDGNYVKTDKDNLKTTIPHTFTAETVDADYLKSEADCTNATVYYKSCTACGLSSKDTANENTFTSGTAKGHTFTAEIADIDYLKIAADCTNVAVYYKSCLDCGLSSKGTDDEDTFTYGTAKGHSYTGDIKMDTDGKDGTHSFKCVNGCGQYSGTVAHTWDDGTPTTSATHLKEGVMTYECACGATYTVPIAKIADHSYNKTVTDPTCEEKGYTTYTCACGDSYKDDYVDAKGHDFTGTVKMDTDGKDGTHSYACANGCGQFGGTTSHVWGEGTVATPATHLEKGVMAYTCACGAKKTEDIAKLEGHTYIDTVVDPTCTDKGYTLHTCACGDSYKDNYVDALGHNYDNGTCLNCGKTEPSNCTCMCHSSPIAKLIYMILDIILTFFGSSYDCRCGESHF